jgi:hypothetical protein
VHIVLEAISRPGDLCTPHSSNTGKGVGASQSLSFWKSLGNDGGLAVPFVGTPNL